MDAFLVSAGVVALAEFGDKSQLLVLALTARFRKPVPIIMGILVATLINHAIAAELGTWAASMIGPLSMRWILGLSFVSMGLWTLLPGTRTAATSPQSRFGVFGTTAISYFLLEMGDKTQFATIALAAKFGSPVAVVLGSTLGILLADVPVVLLGGVAAQRLSTTSVHNVAPAIFLAIGAIILLGAGG
jgi:putative Ca2+/H+ antiporter (TMEM165/GDT1 family)